MSVAPTYPIFGGPLDGGWQPDSATIYAHRDDGLSARADLDDTYRYVLVEHSGSRAFVPEGDRDLIAAFHESDGDREGAKATVLASELERRNIDL